MFRIGPTVGASKAPRNSRNLPMNPAVSGRPIRLNSSTPSVAAETGCVCPRPARSSTVSVLPSRPDRCKSTANAPTVISP